jgi:peptidoglycan/LPS O-acetylase OafA/YrhL
MQRVKELDSIRGLASLTIVFYHLWFAEVGLLGTAVDLFFVLSGFLITSILLTHEINVGFVLSFYARRALRIWPIYYLSLITLVLINPFTVKPGPLDGLSWFATFTQNIAYHWSATVPPFIPAFRHTWSVAIEEQFYMFWPALVWLIGRRGIVPGIVSLVVLAVGTRVFQFNNWILATHCDGLALGALLSHWTLPADRQKQSQEPAYWVWLAAAGFFWLGSALVLHLLAPGWSCSLVGTIQAFRLLSLNVVFFALVGLIFQYKGHRRLRILCHPWLVYLGQISYGLYLYHHIIFMLWDDYVEKLGIEPYLVLDVVKVALSFAVATLSWKFIEQPLLSLKGRFRYRRDVSQPAGEEAQVQRPAVAVFPIPVNAIRPVRPLRAAYPAPREVG